MIFYIKKKYNHYFRSNFHLKLVACVKSEHPYLSCEISEALHIIETTEDSQLREFLLDCPPDKFKTPFKELCKGLCGEYSAKMISPTQVKILLSRLINPPEDYVWTITVESDSVPEEVTATFHNHFTTKGSKIVWQHSINHAYGATVTDKRAGYEWAKSLGVDYAKLPIINPTLLGCLTLPDASDIGASVNSKMVCWLFCHDDSFVDIDIPAELTQQNGALAELEEKVKDYLLIAEHFGPEAKEIDALDIVAIKKRNPQTAMLFDLLAEANQLEGDKAYFYTALKKYLQSNVDELEREINIKRHPVLAKGLGDSYLNQRKVESSLELVFELGLMAMGITIPESVRKLKLWTDLYDAATLQVAGVNDLASLRKEVEKGLHSNYYILFKREGETFQEAVTSSNTRTFDGLPNKFELTADILIEKIRSNGLSAHTESVATAISVLRSWQSNHLLWEDLSARHPKR